MKPSRPQEHERQTWPYEAARGLPASSSLGFGLEYESSRSYYHRSPTTSSAAWVSDTEHSPATHSFSQSFSRSPRLFPYELYAHESPSSRAAELSADAPPVSRIASQSQVVSKRVKRPITAEEKRVARQCSVDGCNNYTIDRGLCFRHGGGKTCAREDCGRSAKARGLCWRHGGSVGCTVAGCARGAKSKGLCWSHGGGTKCSIAGCNKAIISKGLCWTHGGGKRCIFDGCKRPASERKHNFCNQHYAELHDGNVVYEV